MMAQSSYQASILVKSLQSNRREDVSESAFWECTDPVQSMQHNQLRDSQFSTVHLEDNTLVRRTRGC